MCRNVLTTNQTSQKNKEAWNQAKFCNVYMAFIEEIIYGTIRIIKLFLRFENILFLEKQPPPPSPPVGHGHPIHEVSRSHSTTNHRRLDSSGRVISSSQRPLPDNTQHSQQTNIHAPGEIQTHNLSKIWGCIEHKSGYRRVT
jgi:hypothetical protein